MTDAISALRFFQIASLSDAEAALELAHALVASRQVEPSTKRSVGAASRQPTVREAASALLRKRGEPMHARKIAEELRNGGSDPSNATVISALARLAKRENTFQRIAPNVFALIEWSQRLPGRTEDEPPAKLQLDGR